MTREHNTVVLCDGCGEPIPDDQMLPVVFVDRTHNAVERHFHSYEHAATWAASQHAAHHEARRVDLASRAEQNRQHALEARAEAAEHESRAEALAGVEPPTQDDKDFVDWYAVHGAAHVARRREDAERHDQIASEWDAALAAHGEVSA